MADNDMGSIERLWDLHRRDADGSARGLNLERILRSAISIADRQGVTDLSMATIAREVGYSTMALYRHVPNKAELLESMVDAATGLPPDDLPEGSGWRERLIAWSLALAGAYRQHQWVFDVPISGPPVTPNSVRWMEAGLTILEETGLGPAEQMGLLTTVTSYVRGNEQLLAEIVRQGKLAGEDPAGTAESYGSMLGRLLPKGDFPALERVIATGILNVSPEVSIVDEHEMDLRFGLEIFLDGVEQFIDRSAGEAAS